MRDLGLYPGSVLKTIQKDRKCRLLVNAASSWTGLPTHTFNNRTVRMQDHSSNSSSQQYMAQGELCVFDDANAPAFSTLSEYTDEYDLRSQCRLCACPHSLTAGSGLFNFNIGSQFDSHPASLDAQLVGWLGPYPDMEQEPRKTTRDGPYLVNSAKQQIWTSSEGEHYRH